jgi:hypothetical protein
MNLHKIHGLGFTRFAGSQAEATKTRMTLADEHGFKKSSLEIEPVEVPTGKAGLLEVLNELAALSDPQPEQD